MARKHRLYSDDFKRQAVARMTASPGEVPALADELGVTRTLLYRWRKQYAAQLVSPQPVGEGPGVRAATEGLGVSAIAEGVTATSEPSAIEPDPVLHDARLRRLMVDATYALALAIRDSTGSAPLNQLATAFGLMIDRLLRLDALAVLAAQAPAPGDEQVIRIEYGDPDGSVHLSPPWARGDPAFEAPIVPGQVRSPFWDFLDPGIEYPDDDPDDESEWD